MWLSENNALSRCVVCCRHFMRVRPKWKHWAKTSWMNYLVFSHIALTLALWSIPPFPWICVLSCSRQVSPNGGLRLIKRILAIISGIIDCMDLGDLHNSICISHFMLNADLWLFNFFAEINTQFIHRGNWVHIWPVPWHLSTTHHVSLMWNAGLWSITWFSTIIDIIYSKKLYQQSAWNFA